MKLMRPQLLQVAGVAVVALCVNTPSRGAEPNIVGNWNVVSYVSEELATGNKTDQLGKHPKGYLIYTPEGRMIGLVVHETRSPPKVDADRINVTAPATAPEALGRYFVTCGDPLLLSINRGFASLAGAKV